MSFLQESLNFSYRPVRKMADESNLKKIDYYVDLFEFEMTEPQK